MLVINPENKTDAKCDQGIMAFSESNNIDILVSTRNISLEQNEKSLKKIRFISVLNSKDDFILSDRTSLYFINKDYFTPQGRSKFSNYLQKTTTRKNIIFLSPQIPESDMSLDILKTAENYAEKISNIVTFSRSNFFTVTSYKNNISILNIGRKLATDLGVRNLDETSEIAPNEPKNKEQNKCNFALYRILEKKIRLVIEIYSQTDKPDKFKLKHVMQAINNENIDMVTKDHSIIL